jgi:hypothetical protein
MQCTGTGAGTKKRKYAKWISKLSNERVVVDVSACDEAQSNVNAPRRILGDRCLGKNSC